MVNRESKEQPPLCTEVFKSKKVGGPWKTLKGVNIRPAPLWRAAQHLSGGRRQSLRDHPQLCYKNCPTSRAPHRLPPELQTE